MTRVTGLWRYPVKSMLGGRVPDAVMTERGCLGDRAWALRDVASGRIASEPRLESQPRVDEKTGIDRRTVFGDVPVSRMRPDWTRETMPDFEIGAT